MKKLWAQPKVKGLNLSSTNEIPGTYDYPVRYPGTIKCTVCQESKHITGGTEADNFVEAHRHENIDGDNTLYTPDPLQS